MTQATAGADRDPPGTEGLKRKLTGPLLIAVAFTAILIGYLVVWLPQPVAGLSFIGYELGEWVKFLPEVRAGEILPGRNFFYLPPITLGLMLLVWSAGSANRHWQTWILRATAVLISLFVFPAVEAIRFEPPSEWAIRLQLILLVILAAPLVGLLGRLPAHWLTLLSWLLIVLLGILGAALPTWAYLAIRPAASDVLAAPVGIGPGIWLNLGGHLLVVGTGLYRLATALGRGAHTA